MLGWFVQRTHTHYTLTHTLTRSQALTKCARVCVCVYMYLHCPCSYTLANDCARCTLQRTVKKERRSELASQRERTRWRVSDRVGETRMQRYA